MLYAPYYLYDYIIGTAALWLLFVLWQWTKTGRVQWTHFPFTVPRYYLVTAFLFVYPVYLGLVRGNTLPIFLFLIFGGGGILAETLLSLWWHIFFEKRFYFYTVEPLAKKYTSGLNFVLWGAGGLMYGGLVNYLAPHLPRYPAAQLMANAKAVTATPNLPFYYIFFLVFGICLSLQILGWASYLLPRRHDHKMQAVTLGNYLFITFPLWLPIVACAVIYGINFLTFALWFGVVGAMLEYGFGKLLQQLLTKKLWVYNFWAVDDGHFTPLSIIPFAFLGFYFWGLALFIQLLIK